MCNPYTNNFICEETEFLYTSDAWRVVVEIDLSVYHDTISVIRSDMIIEQQKQEFKPVYELKHGFIPKNARC